MNLRKKEGNEWLSFWKDYSGFYFNVILLKIKQDHLCFPVIQHEWLFFKSYPQTPLFSGVTFQTTFLFFLERTFLSVNDADHIRSASFIDIERWSQCTRVQKSMNLLQIFIYWLGKNKHTFCLKPLEFSNNIQKSIKFTLFQFCI